MAHPLPSPPRLVLFDLDETLLDNRSAAQHAMRTCVGERGDIFGRITAEQAFERWSAINAQLWNDYGRGALNGRQLRHQRVARLLVWACESSGECYTEAMASEFGERYLELFVEAARPLDGVPELLNAIAVQVPVGVVTNGFVDIQRARIERSGIGHHISQIVVSEEIGARKPDPAIFHHALKLFGAEPHEAVMVGDSLDYDIAGAGTAGIATVWLRRGEDARADDNGVASASVQNIDELSALLRSRFHQ